LPLNKAQRTEAAGFDIGDVKVFNWIKSAVSGQKENGRKKPGATKELPMSTPDQIIPAHFGYSLLRFCYLDRKVTAEFVTRAENLKVMPIIAWRILSDGAVSPVAISDPQPADGCIEAVLFPNNMIYDLHGRAWTSVQAWAVEAAAPAWKAWREGHGVKEAPPAAEAKQKSDVISTISLAGTRSNYLGEVA
jgi:hypothetical protein